MTLFRSGLDPANAFEEESIELLYSSTDSNCTRNGRADRDEPDGLITKNHKHNLMPGSVQVRLRRGETQSSVFK